MYDEDINTLLEYVKQIDKSSWQWETIKHRIALLEDHNINNKWAVTISSKWKKFNNKFCMNTITGDKYTSIREAAHLLRIESSALGKDILYNESRRFNVIEIKRN